MKKILIACACMSAFGCVKQEKAAKHENSIQTLFENKNLQELRSKPFNPFRNDYTTRIEKIGFGHSSLSKLKSDPGFQAISKQFKLDLSNITRHFYDHSATTTTFIPVKNTEKKQVLVVYAMQGKYHFTFSRERLLTNGYTHVSYSSVQNPASLFYEFQISKEHTLGNFKVYRSPFSGADFSEPVSERPAGEAISTDSESNYEFSEGIKYGCCSKKFNDCMNCFLKSCGEDWKCWVLCGVGWAYCGSSWAVSCSTGYGCKYPAITTDQGNPNNPRLPIDSSLVLDTTLNP